jgi:uncharacterized protein (DUF1810 family)
MWFVFPQIAGLGHSATARRYAIASLAEAKAYVAHRVLGPRLHDCGGIVAATPAATAEQIFGVLEATKQRSSMTLFSCAAPTCAVFPQVLDRYFDGAPDPPSTIASSATDRRRSDALLLVRYGSARSQPVPGADSTAESHPRSHSDRTQSDAPSCSARHPLRARGRHRGRAAASWASRHAEIARATSASAWRECPGKKSST